MPDQQQKQKTLFIFDSPPYGAANVQEGLDALLSASIFEQPVAVLFIGDGLFQLISGQAPNCEQSIEKQLRSLEMYDITEIYIAESAWNTLPTALQKKSVLNPVLLSADQISALLRRQTHIFRF